MIRALFLSIGQLFDRRVAGVFVKSLLLTLLLFAASGVALWFGLREGLPAFGRWLLAHSGTPGPGQSVFEWMAGSLGAAFAGTAADTTVADLITLVVMLLAHWLLFRVIAIGVIGVFADEVVEAVEARHYRDAHANARSVPFWQSLRMGVGSGVRAVGMNILFSPVYLIALPVAPFVFFALNAWLLSRDLGDMVAVRHMPESELKRWRGRTRFRRLMVGSVATALFLVPGLALLAPILGAAMAANSFHQGRQQ